ncbi:hypothetical protein I5677_00705 [Mobilitalea sibirica]|uniref:DegT/DnrJ/EryC1/StrS aminotransferase family protein n=2 Tax=Mobilitalea sibirica TaxID=1462919 RepID=A0A8J7H099_9FIRM|nr:hypothetical protein [Mobilitalea sibirica]
MEIGSEFWLENNRIYEGKDINWLYGNTVFTSSGRGALTLLLKQIKPRWRTALLPAYLCNSMILPFLNEGYLCKFYKINQELEPDLSDLHHLEGVGVFVHMGYFGYRTNQNLQDIIKKLKQNSTIILEDITHSIGSKYQGFEENDYYIASLRKWFGIPSGGILGSSVREIHSDVLNENELFTFIRREALLLKGEYIKTGDEKLKKLYQNLFAMAEQLLEEEKLTAKIDSLSMRIIRSIDFNEIREKRRANYSYLYKGIKDVSFITPVFHSLPDGVCPMFFPIYTLKNRAEIRKKLTNASVYCPIHWPVPTQLTESEYKKASLIYDRILSIPCDQRYGHRDMKRICHVLKNLKVS